LTDFSIGPFGKTIALEEVSIVYAWQSGSKKMCPVRTRLKTGLAERQGFEAFYRLLESVIYRFSVAKNIKSAVAHCPVLPP
jgi:hypothetical protein